MLRFSEAEQSQSKTHNFNRLPEICFDPENILLEGWYRDELSAYRAKKIWQETLAHYFLLESDDDFDLTVDKIGGAYRLSCGFYSACARYAFWRITNDQAPEAQYIIETAHIPQTESFNQEHISAPDMKPITDDPLILTGLGAAPRYNESWLTTIKKLFQKISDS